METTLDYLLPTESFLQHCRISLMSLLIPYSSVHRFIFHQVTEPPVLAYNDTSLDLLSSYILSSCCYFHCLQSLILLSLHHTTKVSLTVICLPSLICYMLQSFSIIILSFFFIIYFFLQVTV